LTLQTDVLIKTKIKLEINRPIIATIIGKHK
jgi:hypothetical protein